MKKWLFGIVLLFVGQLAHAQVGPCPPGMSEYSSPNGIPSCGPHQSPHGYWETQWGALAQGDDGTAGWSSNQSNEEVAKKAATENCISRGGSHCEVQMTYWNGCLAVVIGDHTTTQMFRHSTREKAVKGAMKLCKNAGQKSCELFRVECSPAKWVSN